MAGDHKCPVCHSTFTRPQHVARHMRSHTGDRPYKCQHCGDAFARSDLLSRHVNKCHSAEKAAADAAAIAAGLPPPGKGRKRINLSNKAPCDQCILSKQSCNSAEPCSKCVTKNIKCTYNQMPLVTGKPAPALHSLPSLSLPQNMRGRSSFDSSSSPSSSSAYPPVDYGYSVPTVSGHAPSDALYANLTNSLPPQFNFPPSLYTSTGIDLPPRSDADTSPVYSLNSYNEPFDHPSLHQQQQQPFADPASSYKYPYLKAPSSQRSIYNPDTSSSATELPPAEVSSHHHLSSGIPAGSHYALPDLGALPSTNFALPPTDGRPQTAGEGGFSNAFGSMSLDDPAVLANLAQHAPYFHQQEDPSMSSTSMRLPAHSTQASWENAVKDRLGVGRYSLPTLSSNPFGGGTSSNEDNDVREFWHSFMRTPSDKTVRLARKGSDGYLNTSGNNHGNDSIMSNGTERPGQLSRRWSRRASLPATKTPPALVDSRSGQQQSSYYQHQPPPQQSELANGVNPQPMTRPDELRAYEQAILARGGPPELKLDMNSLGPRRRKMSTSSATGRPVLPLGRNAPFIGPPPLQSHSHTQSHSLSGSDASLPNSQQSSPIYPHGRSLPDTQGRGHMPQLPPPSTWDHPQATRPTPKRNASQLLESDLQKSHRPAGATDVSGEYSGESGSRRGSSATEEDLPPIRSATSTQAHYQGSAQYSPALSNASGSNFSQSGSRPGTAHSTSSHSHHGHSSGHTAPLSSAGRLSVRSPSPLFSSSNQNQSQLQNIRNTNPSPTMPFFNGGGSQLFAHSRPSSALPVPY